MKPIDQYSYNCGIMDCFNEMVKAGLKRIALAHPFASKELRNQYLPFVETITQKYHTYYYLDDDPLLTDLFPYSLNKNTYNIIFYKNKSDIDEYLALKDLKAKAIQNKEYDQYRQEIAYRFGKLLSYSKEAIEDYIKNNFEKE